MKFGHRIVSNDRGAAAIEMAFALPTVVIMLWAFVQLAQVYRAVAGMQQALGEGARYATLCLSASPVGACSSPTTAQVRARVQSSVYGIGPGTFTVDPASVGSSGTASYYDLTVCYSQPTNLLLIPGPTINVYRSKRVWIAQTNATASTNATSCAS